MLPPFLHWNSPRQRQSPLPEGRNDQPLFRIPAGGAKGLFLPIPPRRIQERGGSMRRTEKNPGIGGAPCFFSYGKGKIPIQGFSPGEKIGKPLKEPQSRSLIFLFPEKTKGFELSRAGDRRPKKEKQEKEAWKLTFLICYLTREAGQKELKNERSLIGRPFKS